MAETLALEGWVYMLTLSCTRAGARRFVNHSKPHFFLCEMKIMLSDLSASQIVGWTSLYIRSVLLLGVCLKLGLCKEGSHKDSPGALQKHWEEDTCLACLSHRPLHPSLLGPLLHTTKWE